VSEVDDLKRIVDFLPAWRIDDIMVSYACDGGGVGPHFDQYDVFLIQGQGSRRWQIGQSCNSDSPLRPDTGLSLLEHFEPVAEYLLEPGDILYVPPRVAHYGVSLGESLCYSVGFRAPSHAELIQEFSDLLIDSLTEDQRFTDPSFHSVSDAGAISEPAISRAFKEVAGLVDNRSLLTDAFAGFVTRPRYPDRITAPDSAPDEQMTIEQLGIPGFGSRLYKNPASRFACFPDGSRLRVYADGRRYDCSADLLPLVNRLSEAPWSQPLFPGGLPQSRAVAGLLCWLLAQGSLLEDSASDTPDHDD
ncbi:MAG: cupin domain-containing protein, partial [Pseudomonadales bacterium]|nr:cupin domain-containing protein [Pseudomonadales bacterium]